MNKNIKLAVAGAVLALSATANAGIIIPAGDWTVDIGGNVNAFYQNTRFSGDLESTATNAPTNKTTNTVSTGLLPAALGIGAKTRQNDLDVAFQFTFFTGVDSTDGNGSAGVFGANGAGGNSLNIRQAFLSFGDKSWGSVKMGRDLGVFGSDAILSDMTLLGVGTGAGGNGNSTLGRIGSGYLYADWVGQIQYTTPNWNGLQLTAAARQPWANSANSDLGFDAKAVYSWAGDVSGKVWVGGISQKTRSAAVAARNGLDTNGDDQTFATWNALSDANKAAYPVAPIQGVDARSNRANAWDIGANINIDKANLVGYYYNGKNMGGNSMSGVLQLTGLGIANPANDFDVRGGYVQGTYVIPTGTKLGASYGLSRHEGDTAGDRTFESKSYVLGAYHPLTKHLNLVAEYTHHKLDNIGGTDNVDGKAKTVSLGAILFF
jgi:predicted porin